MTSDLRAEVTPHGASAIVIEVWGIEPMPSPRPRAVARGKFVSMYMPKKYKDWKAAVVAALQSAPLPLFDGPVRAELTTYTTRPKTTKRASPRGDIDNHAKSVLDALTDAGIWRDDEDVVELDAGKLWATRRPGFVVRIETVS